MVMQVYYNELFIKKKHSQQSYSYIVQNFSAFIGHLQENKAFTKYFIQVKSFSIMLYITSLV